ncbi:hypothetical protein SDC9_26242 [bioreactor metagenome]|nr:hypothetical protein HMPREF0322_01391 [Desulfitobacterium hafniense DP7]
MFRASISFLSLFSNPSLLDKRVFIYVGRDFFVHSLLGAGYEQGMAIVKICGFKCLEGAGWKFRHSPQSGLGGY